MTIPETDDNPFKWKQFSHDIILWSVRWYCQFALTYRDLVMMMEERGLSASHTTIMRWVHQYATEIKKRLKKFLKTSNDSYRIDETYIKVKGVWHYLYRAVDSEGNTLDWMLSEKRNQKAAEEFFKQLLSNNHCFVPRVMNFDKNTAYPPAFKTIKHNGLIPETTELRQVKYLNNMVEQDHRFSKRRIVYSQWLQTFETAEATISGYESMHMIRKGQIEGVGKKDIVAQKKFINDLFGIAA
jgi:transposase-like protein